MGTGNISLGKKLPVREVYHSLVTVDLMNKWSYSASFTLTTVTMVEVTGEGSFQERNKRVIYETGCE
jgi:hypothetical protein